MIPNYQIDILKKEKNMALVKGNKGLFNALSNTIRVLETHKCPVQQNKQAYVCYQDLDGFKNDKGESQNDKYGK